MLFENWLFRLNWKMWRNKKQEYFAERTSNTSIDYWKKSIVKVILKERRERLRRALPSGRSCMIKRNREENIFFSQHVLLLTSFFYLQDDSTHMIVHPCNTTGVCTLYIFKGDAWNINYSRNMFPLLVQKFFLLLPAIYIFLLPFSSTEPHRIIESIRRYFSRTF